MINPKITGKAIKNPQNYEVALGTPMKFLLEDANFNEKQASRLISGGPMMGFSIESTQIPITKTKFPQELNSNN